MRLYGVYLTIDKNNIFFRVIVSEIITRLKTSNNRL